LDLRAMTCSNEGARRMTPRHGDHRGSFRFRSGALPRRTRYRFTERLKTIQAVAATRSAEAR
jgi:hypothetical protein